MEYKEDDDDEELLAQNLQLSIYLNPLASCIEVNDQKFDTFVLFEYCVVIGDIMLY